MIQKESLPTINGRPLRREVLVTLNKEIETSESGLILNAEMGVSPASDGFLVPEQYVVKAGPYCDDVKRGDKVFVDFDRYKRTQPTNQMSQTKEVVYNIPTLEFDGVTYGRIQETDIIWVFEDNEG